MNNNNPIYLRSEKAGIKEKGTRTFVSECNSKEPIGLRSARDRIIDYLVIYLS